MSSKDLLKDKKILVVDDDPDIVESIVEILETSHVDSAYSFEAAKQLLQGNSYDFAVLDIMGVNGYGLLELALKKEIVVVMLTAHALSPIHFKTSIKGGAYAYLPKEKLADIDRYLIMAVATELPEGKKDGRWYSELKQTFQTTFGSDWEEEQAGESFWSNFRRIFTSSNDDTVDT